ncbi:hypothetical protein JOM56_004325 [Amanita muscaria]
MSVTVIVLVIFLIVFLTIFFPFFFIIMIIFCAIRTCHVAKLSRMAYFIFAVRSGGMHGERGGDGGDTEHVVFWCNRLEGLAPPDDLLRGLLYNPIILEGSYNKSNVGAYHSRQERHGTFPGPISPINVL